MTALSLSCGMWDLVPWPGIEPGVIIKLHCYLLIDGRHKEWYGRTFEEALDKAEAGINTILEEYGEQSY